MRYWTVMGVALLTMCIITGCQSPAPSAVVNGTPDQPGQWHGPVKKVTTMGISEALFDPVESPGVYYKLTSKNYVEGSSTAPPILLDQYAGSQITVRFQKQADGILWGAVIVKQ